MMNQQQAFYCHGNYGVYSDFSKLRDPIFSFCAMSQTIIGSLTWKSGASGWGMPGYI